MNCKSKGKQVEGGGRANGAFVPVRKSRWGFLDMMWSGWLVAYFVGPPSCYKCVKMNDLSEVSRSLHFDPNRLLKLDVDRHSLRLRLIDDCLDALVFESATAFCG